jgi:hypothetical protein
MFNVIKIPPSPSDTAKSQYVATNAKHQPISTSGPYMSTHHAAVTATLADALHNTSEQPLTLNSSQCITPMTLHSAANISANHVTEAYHAAEDFVSLQSSAGLLFTDITLTDTPPTSEVPQRPSTAVVHTHAAPITLADHIQQWNDTWTQNPGKFATDHPRSISIDASYVIHDRDKKSHSSCSIVLGTDGPLYTTSVKQSIVTKPSTEAELVAFPATTSAVITLRHLPIGQGYPAVPTTVYQDNISTTSLIDNGGPCSKRSRHIDIRHLEKITDISIQVVRCPAEIMWANFLTKPVQCAQLIIERQLINWVT